MYYSAWSKIALAGLFASATAQTYSECNPMKKSCDPNKGLASSSYSVDFTKGADEDNWEGTGHGTVKYTSDGAEFTVAKQGDSPTIQSKWYMFFGRMEVHLKAAPGTGIVSSVVLLSDVLDEVDWEWLGGKDGDVQTNYYGKGNDAADTRSATFPVTNAQEEFHNYTIHWTKDSCEWYINNVAVRSLKYADALGGENYPQTPMRVKLGIWAGGDPDNAEGTIEWAGGETDYAGAPYTMTVQKIMIENLNPADSYTYSDETGSYKSIKFDEKDSGSADDEESSTASETASKTSSKTSSSESTFTTKATTETDSEASTTASSDDSAETKSTDFKNNKAETTSADATSSESSASASATDGSTNSAAGNWPKMWLALGATFAAMVMM
ncbi:concanavalin A-like lectin/glucanase domain-containing protein [Fusarium redolens]|uniref:Crh-like protein n=1 Tax=Fusarium redolens TaxID=48865 RepID=A0A9P9JPV9_FUSRE|nr:concanavalin A-like lectin/glucanase domain-containing protein [Fusarium redolens]KAH7216909.1 concanavalin A-like lectin/glucanase domain-containing protein [Fusarium redolens]